MVHRKIKKKHGVHRYTTLQKKLKKVEWVNPNKMKFESAHKEFNRQTALISTGNVLGSTQLSFFIRPFNTPKNPVGEKVARGAMQNYDLNQFTHLPYHIRDFVKNQSVNENVILYEFRHFKNGRKIVDGYVVTTSDYKLLGKFYINNNWKAMDAVDEATKYIAHGKSV